MTANKEIIAIDLGNSRISCGLFQSGALIESWFFPTNEATAAARSISAKAAGLVAICSVVPAATNIIKTALETAGKQVLVLPSGQSQIISGVYSGMGADRIADAVAAWSIYGKEHGAIVVDLGTATTLTAVDKNGRFAGGFITLGVGKTIASLHKETAQLPMAAFKQSTERELCFDTESAIFNGSVLGQTGLIEYWIKIARKSLGFGAKIIATGGWAETISRQSTVFDITDPLLTMRGVYLSAEQEAVLADPG